MNKQLFRHLGALSVAILTSAALASVIQTQINLAELTALGAPVGAGTRIATTLEDLARFGPVMAGITAAAFLLALPAGHAVSRKVSARLRSAVLALAGVAGLGTAFWLLGKLSPMPALVEATGSVGGLAAVCLSGLPGGALYAGMTAAGRPARGRLRAVLPLAALVLVPALLFYAMAPRPGAAVVRADPAGYRVQTLVTGLDRPWSVAFLPDGRTLVTEREGRLLALGGDGKVAAIALGGLPPVLRTGGGPLMNIVVDPAFAQNRLLYLTMGYGRPGANGTRLLRARLDGDRLADVRVLFSSTLKSSPGNNGGALAVLADGTLVMSVGDGHRREQAQVPGNHIGKLVRVDREGRAPDDNPFAGRPGAAPELYSLGHRNPQGLARDPATGALLLSDHGPRGGDEINLIEAGKNYGWPLATGGIDYSFARVTPFRGLDGFARPLLDWTPSIAPGGLAVYDGEMFRGWRGDLLVPALKERSLRRVRRENGRIVGQELLLAELGERLRDVKVAPDGSIYVLTDGENARLLRVVPARAGG